MLYIIKYVGYKNLFNEIRNKSTDHNQVIPMQKERLKISRSCISIIYIIHKLLVLLRLLTPYNHSWQGLPFHLRPDKQPQEQ